MGEADLPRNLDKCRNQMCHLIVAEKQNLCLARKLNFLGQGALGSLPSALIYYLDIKCEVRNCTNFKHPIPSTKDYRQYCQSRKITLRLLFGTHPVAKTRLQMSPARRLIVRLSKTRTWRIARSIPVSTGTATTAPVATSSATLVSPPPRSMLPFSGLELADMTIHPIRSMCARGLRASFCVGGEKETPEALRHAYGLLPRTFILWSGD